MQIHTRLVYFLALFFLLTGENVLAQGKSFVCEFSSSIHVYNEKNEQVRTVTKNEVEKLTFMLDERDSSGTYINLAHGMPSPFLASVNGQTAIFLEANSSDNHFVVTVFLGKGSDRIKPAVMSQHSWSPPSPDASRYVPRLSIGSCVASVSRR